MVRTNMEFYVAPMRIRTLATILLSKAAAPRKNQDHRIGAFQAASVRVRSGSGPINSKTITCTSCI